MKVGVGPGSICTTRVVTGVGVPQFTAIVDSAQVASRYGIPVIADGGIKYSGDLVKALAGGASMVMIGSLFAGTDEAPGELILFQGRSYKVYRGMGSIGAMASGRSSDRYAQGDVTETSKSAQRHRGACRIAAVDQQRPSVARRLRSGMGYCGAANLAALREKASFVRISSAGLQESHVHDVIITKEAPNYWIE